MTCPICNRIYCDGHFGSIQIGDDCLPIPPNRFRPSSYSYQHPITSKVQGIIYSKTSEKKQKYADYIRKFDVNNIINHKTGLFRHSLVGKHVDFSFRFVITCDIQLAIDTIEIPETVREIYFKSRKERSLTLTFPQYIYLNRQPTLWAFNFMSFKVSFTKDKVIRFNPIICSCYNADFDGDQMNLFLVENFISIAECVFLSSIEKNLLSYQFSKLNIKLIQDITTGLFIMWNENPLSLSTIIPSCYNHMITNFNQDEINRILYRIYRDDETQFYHTLYKLIEIGIEYCDTYGLSVSPYSFTKEHSLHTMVTAKTKGSRDSIKHMIDSIGDVPVLGKSKHLKGNFLHGLDANEFYHSQRNGWEISGKGSIETAETGAMNRQLGKALGNLIVSYMGTVVDHKGNCYSFAYGGDLIDPAFVEQSPCGPVPYNPLPYYGFNTLPSSSRINNIKRYVDSCIKDFYPVNNDFDSTATSYLFACSNTFPIYKHLVPTIIHPGTHVGLRASTAFCEIMTQMSLGSKHGGNKSKDDFTLIKEILSFKNQKLFKLYTKFGISACESYIIQYLYNIYSKYSNIHIRHLQLIASVLTFTGEVRTIKEVFFPEDSVSNGIRMNAIKVMKTAIKADKLDSVDSAVGLGRIPRVGTNIFDIVQTSLPSIISISFKNITKDDKVCVTVINNKQDLLNVSFGEITIDNYKKTRIKIRPQQYSYLRTVISKLKITPEQMCILFELCVLFQTEAYNLKCTLRPSSLIQLLCSGGQQGNELDITNYLSIINKIPSSSLTAITWLSTSLSK